MDDGEQLVVTAVGRPLDQRHGHPDAPGVALELARVGSPADAPGTAAAWANYGHSFTDLFGVFSLFLFFVSI